ITLASLFSTALEILAKSSVDVAKGFSTRACFPCSTAWIKTGRCSFGGVVTRTASTSVSRKASSRSEKCVTPRFSRLQSRASADGSTVPTSCTFGWIFKTSVHDRPHHPRPAIKNRIESFTAQSAHEHLPTQVTPKTNPPKTRKGDRHFGKGQVEC